MCQYAIVKHLHHACPYFFFCNSYLWKCCRREITDFYVFTYFTEIIFQIFVSDFFVVVVNNNPILLTNLWKSEAASKISSHNVINCLSFDVRALKRKFLRRIKHTLFRLPGIYFLWQELWLVAIWLIFS